MALFELFSLGVSVSSIVESPICQLFEARYPISIGKHPASRQSQCIFTNTFRKNSFHFLEFLSVTQQKTSSVACSCLVRIGDLFPELGQSKSEIYLFGVFS